MQYINAAKNAIQNGEPERAIMLLREYLESVQTDQIKKIMEDLILIGSRFSLLKNDKIRELVSFEMANQELNKINASLLQVICDLEEQVDDKAIFQKSLLMNMPRNAVSDYVYYGFLLFGMIAGSGFLAAFCYTFYHYLKDGQTNFPVLLFIGSLGFCTTAFLFGAYEGINRREGMLVNWKITGPQVALAIGLMLAAAVLSLIP